MADPEQIEEGSRTPLKDFTNRAIITKRKSIKLSESGGGETIKEVEVEIGEDTSQHSDNSDQPSNYSVPASPSKNNTDADTTDYESADEGFFPQKASKTPSQYNPEPEAVDQPSFDSHLLEAFKNLKVDTDEPNFVQRWSLEFNSPTEVHGETKVENTLVNFVEELILTGVNAVIEEQPSFQNLFVEKSESPVKHDAVAVAEAPNSPAEVHAEPDFVQRRNVVKELQNPVKVTESEIKRSPSVINLAAEESKSPVKVNSKPVALDQSLGGSNQIAEGSESAEFKILEQSSIGNFAEVKTEPDAVDQSPTSNRISEGSKSPDEFEILEQSSIENLAEVNTEPEAVDQSPTSNLISEGSKSPAEFEILEQSSIENLAVDESPSPVEVNTEPEAVDQPSIDCNQISKAYKSRPEDGEFEIAETSIENLVEEEFKRPDKFNAEPNANSNSVTESKTADAEPEIENSSTENLVAERSESPAKVNGEPDVVENSVVVLNLEVEKSKNEVDAESGPVKVNAEPLAIDQSSDYNSIISEEYKSSEKVDAVQKFIQRQSIESSSAQVEEPNVVDSTSVEVKAEPVALDQSIVSSNISVESSPNKVDSEPEVKPPTDLNLAADESKISPKVDAETIDAKLKYLLTNLLDKNSSEDNSEKDKSETDPEESIVISGSKEGNQCNSRWDLSCVVSPIRPEGNNSVASSDLELNQSNASDSEYNNYSFNFAPNTCNISSPQEIVIFKKPFDKKDEKLSLKQALIDEEIAQRLNDISLKPCTNRNLSSIQEEATIVGEDSESSADVLKSEIASTNSSFIREDSLEPNFSRKSSIREDSLEPSQNIFSNKVNTMDKSFNGLQELYETCSKQERELGCDVAEPVLFNLSFAAEAKRLAEDISKMDINGEDLNDIKPPQYMMQSSLPPEINNSEAGPVTADEDFNKSDYFQDPQGGFDCDYFSKFDSKAKRTALSRDSLFLKFDPLLGELVSGDLNESNMSERASDATVIENNKTPSRNDTAPLVDITPLGRRSVHSTSSGTKSQSNTPTLKQEVLSKEISKLQHLMVQQEAAHQELLIEKTDEVENLRKRVAELETKAPQRDIEERVKFLESENAKLNKELKESQASNKQLTAVMAEYEKTISQLVTNKEEMVSQYEKTKDEIAQERDTAISHLNNMEVAFNDVHAKYEKVKSIVEIQHGNEKLLKESLEAHTKTIEQQKSNYEKLKRHASEKLDGANREILTLKSSNQMEMAKMNAVAKKSDLKIKSLEESLEQKTKEIRELTQICDELIEQQDKIFGEETIIHENNKEPDLNFTFQLRSLQKERGTKKKMLKETNN